MDLMYSFIMATVIGAFVHSIYLFIKGVFKQARLELDVEQEEKAKEELKKNLEKILILKIDVVKRGELTAYLVFEAIRDKFMFQVSTPEEIVAYVFGPACEKKAVFMIKHDDPAIANAQLLKPIFNIIDPPTVKE